MKKILWVVIVLYGFLPVNGQEKAAKSNTDTEQSQRSPSPVSVTVINQPTTKDESETPKKNPKGYLSELVAPNNLPTLLLVLIGIGGIYVAIGTLRSLDEQTSATRKAADAAKASTDGFLQAERAWILASLVPYDSIGGLCFGTHANRKRDEEQTF